MRKPNRIDLIILLFVVAGAFVLFLKFNQLNTPSEQVNSVTMRQAEILFSIRGVRIGTTEAFKIGDTVLADETNSVVGTITDIKVIPYEERIEKIDGTLVYAVIPEKYTITLKIDTQYSIRETGYFAEGITELKINSVMRIYTKFVNTTGVIEEIRL